MEHIITITPAGPNKGYSVKASKDGDKLKVSVPNAVFTLPEQIDDFRTNGLHCSGHPMRYDVIIDTLYKWQNGELNTNFITYKDAERLYKMTH